MRIPLFLLLAILLVALSYSPAMAGPASPRVRLETTYGNIILSLDPAAAPATVANFLDYVRQGFYDGTIFHRVIRGFMIQGGGYGSDLRLRPARPPIPNEADNGLSNLRGTIAMARTGDPNSATSQFFINTVDNRRLDHAGKTPSGWGYCVFGKVAEGMDVVDRIEKTPVGPRGQMTHLPVTPVVINRAVVEDPS